MAAEQRSVAHRAHHEVARQQPEDDPTDQEPTAVADVLATAVPSEPSDPQSAKTPGLDWEETEIPPTAMATPAATSTPMVGPAPGHTPDTPLPSTPLPADTRLPEPTATATLTATPSHTPSDMPPPSATATLTPTVPVITAPPETATVPQPTATTAASAPPTELPPTVPVPSATPMPTPNQPGPPSLWISEFLADPAAVSDEAGEFIELFNGSQTAVNLRGWQLSDLDSDNVTIAVDLVVAPGELVVLARNDDVTLNGGLPVDMVMTGMQLANRADELLLTAPDGTEVDRVLWGDDHGLHTTAGASLERSGFGAEYSWQTAQRVWPGSAGDRGSPRAPYMALQPEPSATPSPQRTAMPPTPPSTLTPTETTPIVWPSPTESQTLEPMPPSTPTVAPAHSILISEFLADPQAVADENGEFVELFNGGTIALNLRGWYLSDLDNDHHLIDADLIIEPNGFVLLGRNPDRTVNGGLDLDYRLSGTALANGTDEILLIDPSGRTVDQVAWGDGGPLSIATGASAERMPLEVTAPWRTATTPWPGSAGDAGSPGTGPLPAPEGSPTPSPIPSPSAPAQPTRPATPLAPSPSATPTAPADPVGDILITEFLADPNAVADGDGEWIELFNRGDDPVNLRGWSLADQGSDRHVFPHDLFIGPSAYLLLARNGTPQQNGGVKADYIYTGITLANGADELLLQSPSGAQVDRVLWGSGLTIKAGVSLERTDLSIVAHWAYAQTPWPDSAGDLGSPGLANSPGPLPTPTADPMATPLPTTAPTAAPGDRWPPAEGPSPLQLDEIAYQGSAGEFVVVRNVGDQPLPLSGWSIGDAERPGDGEGIYALPEEAVLSSGQRLVIARNAVGFHGTYGRWPDADFEGGEPTVLALQPRTGLASGTFALSDSGDEVVLLTPAHRLADAAAVKGGDLSALRLTGTLAPARDFSLQRTPNRPFDPAIDQRQRYLYARPEPFASLPSPSSSSVEPVALGGGLMALWGTLGAQSSYSEGHTAPPAYLLDATAADGLHFAAIADPAPAEIGQSAGGTVQVPAWHWQGEQGEEAIVYSSQMRPITTLPELATFLEESGSVAQWLGDGPIPPGHFVAFSGEETDAPGNLKGAVDRWQQAGRPLLIAGNSNPTLPGETDPRPRFTGLAAVDLSLEAVQEALGARRGWLTNRPGIWLTLHVGDGQSSQWMGSERSGTNQVTVQVEYGDLQGDVAGLAIWRDGRPVAELAGPSSGGTWSIPQPAIPGTAIFAVATQPDGDFAITAPIRILAEMGTVRIDEVMPSPSHDYNGDGLLDNDDEYIELFNLGQRPVSIAGWQLSDSRGDQPGGRRFTFGPDRYIGGGQRLLVWRAESYINLDDDEDTLRLLNAQGDEVDRFSWQLAPKGGAYSRSPETSQWQTDSVPTPGDIYGGQHGVGSEPVETVDPTEGEAGGPPGSVAAAKRAGLERWVEFRAVVVVPSGLFNSAIYVADPVAITGGTLGGIGMQLYLDKGEFPPLAEGDRVWVQGLTQSFRGEMELLLDDRSQIWRVEAGQPLAPLPIAVGDVGEALEGRLVTFDGVVTGWQGSSIFLGTVDSSQAEPVRVTVRASLDWRRPYVNIGDRFRVVGVISQFATEKPWNGGYRVMVRYPSDLVRLAQ